MAHRRQKTPANNNKNKAKSQPLFTSCPPNWLRNADRILPVKLELPLDFILNRKDCSIISAGTPSSLAVSTVHWPSPLWPTSPDMPSKSVPFSTKPLSSHPTKRDSITL